MVTALPIEPWACSRERVLEELEVSKYAGLERAEVARRLVQFGGNLLAERKRKRAGAILFEQFKSLIVLLLVVAAGLSLAFGEWVDAAAISVVMILNAAIGFGMELKAFRSMEALRRLGMVSARVLRDGRPEQIPAAELVPGDIALLEGGDVVPADIRLVEASRLQADESSLTGESYPADKNPEVLPKDTHPAERVNMLFRGTAVTRGSAVGVVVATGIETELGRISSLAEEAQAEATPLEKRLAQLGRKLIGGTLAIAALVAVSGILTGKGLFLMIETAIALAVATIPEGLPIVTNIALAQGMWRMARRNALINRLSAVETLGATTVICTDKTGTLTENRMTVTSLALDSGEIGISPSVPQEAGGFVMQGKPVSPADVAGLRELLETGVLCNRAALRVPQSGVEAAVGDPLEIALLVAGARAGLDRDRLLQALPEVREEAFDPEVRMMATVHQQGDRYRIAVKGAPESVLEACTQVWGESAVRALTEEDRQRWLERSNQMAHAGLRVLALAAKIVLETDASPYEQLTFLGLAGIQDPPRSDVRDAVLACRNAGIRVVMVTGDLPATGRHVAAAVGLMETRSPDLIHGKDLREVEELSQEERARIVRAPILARLTPKQKLDLIWLHQQSGAVVAMTGDGVNDAPALRKADIGIAMGVRGTQVACQAADMILRDDSFATIVAAIEQGRVIFGNIRTFVFYLLSCNVSEVLVVALASLVNAPLPILPLQILFLNLVTDVFPALALGAGQGDSAIMERPPREPREPILTRAHWLAIGGYGLLITASVLGAFAVALFRLGMSPERAVTISFLTLASAQLLHVFNMRGPDSSVLRNAITRNPWIWGALALCGAMLLAAVYIPGLASVLRLHNPGREGWILIGVMGTLPAVVGQMGLSSRLIRALH